MPTVKRYSKKREAILEVLRRTDSHPSAEWVFQQLKPIYPDLSLATVYRNLTAFRQEGIITSVGVVKGQERFDATVEPHTHFFCSECGGVIDLNEIATPHEMSQAADEAYGVRVDRCQLSFEGKCKTCLDKETKLIQ